MKLPDHGRGVLLASLKSIDRTFDTQEFTPAVVSLVQPIRVDETGQII
ncbi:hypothetical protein [Zavarzinella formosa]|nr:hypothetical protein [Zavarzinella formosa]